MSRLHARIGNWGRFYLAAGWVCCLLPAPVLAQQNGQEAQGAGEEGWGKPNGGIQVGLVLKDKSPTFRYGETLHFAMRLRNVGEKRFEALLKTTTRPSYSLIAGNRIRFDILFGEAKPFQINAGEEKTLPDSDFAFTIVPPNAPPEKPKDADADKAYLGLLPGKYTIDAPMPLWVADADDTTRATGLRSSTGKISFTVWDPHAPLSHRVPLQQQNPILQRLRIAWGETVNGLQGGMELTYPPLKKADGDSQNAPSLGLTFYVRNTTPLPLTISYPNFQDYDWSPMVKNAKGEGQNVNHVFVSGLRGMASHTLQPGDVFAIGNTRLRCLLNDTKAEQKSDFTPTLTAPAGRYTVSLVASVRFQGLDRLDMTLVSAEVPFSVPPQRAAK